MTRVRYLLWLPIALLCWLPCAASVRADAETFYFAVEMEGVICGYSEIAVSPLEEDGRELILLKHYLITHIRALGAEVKSEVWLTYHIDPVTGRFTYHDSEVKQAQLELWSKIYIEGDLARCEYNVGEETTVALPPDVLLENTLIYSHLIRDFVRGGLTEKTYDVFDVREGEVQKITYKMTGIERLTLAGQDYETAAFDVSAEKTGLQFKIWIDTETGYIVQSRMGERRASYRADASVKKRMGMADADELMFADVDVLIPDVHSISYMKVRARMQPSGLRITPESLNVPGQKFTGTVEANLIDGIFEIEHKHYDGLGAPPFPPGFDGDPDLREFLEADGFIESDDPVLIAKAGDLTEGSRDSWEAATRLTEWVGRNIAYAIPGGGSARKTYDIRAGECGAHSFLVAAFCRAVGIPARVVWGCYYVSDRGGAFAQHAWNEIYMGDAGWIPVDATVMENRFADSGHIRVGMYESLTTAFNPIEMEILDYRTTPGGSAEAGGEGGYDFEPYLGEYRGPLGLEARLFVEEGNPTLDIPGKVTLTFNPPDEEGVWRCRITDRLFMTFEEDEGTVAAMDLHETVTMSRQSDPDEVDSDAPPELLPYLGNYLYAQVQAEFEVVHRDGGLAVYDPLAKETIRLQSPDEKGRWVDEFDKNTITFEGDTEGRVLTLTLDVPTRFTRK